MLPQTVSRRPLYAALLIYFALTAALLARVPLNLAPDEPAHFEYVAYLAQTGAFPVFRGAIPPAPGNEFHQPPLYYLLCAPAWKLLGAGVQGYACRAVSMGCGLAVIALIWSAARLIFPEKPRIASLAALFAALFPLHQATGASANNDGLAGFLAAAIFYLIARMNQSGATRRDAWQFGLAAGLAILTKNTLLVLVFSGFIALVFAAKKPGATLAMLPALGTALVIALLVGGPWLMRNQLLYGDPLALGAFSGAAKSAAPGFPTFSAGGMSFFTYARGLVWILFMTTWGFFGGPNSALAATFPLSAAGPRVVQPWLAPLILSCLALPLLTLWGCWRGRNDEETGGENAQIAAQESETAPLAKSVWPGWTLSLALIFLAWAQFAFNFFAGAQARYLHPALLPFCLFMALGWTRLFPRRALEIAGAWAGATLLILTLLNLLVWKTLV